LINLALRAAAPVAAASLPQADTTTVRLPPGVHAADTVVAGSIDYVTPVVQFIFQQPPWLMWTGVALGAVIALVVLWWLWGRRDPILTWFRTRSRGTYAAMGAGAIAALGIATFAGFKSFDFMMNDKRFCNGCHIFVPSGQVWERPDSGDYTLVNKLEGKHDTINCHTCHGFKPVAEGVKMVLWMSGVRDEEIPPHGKVPRKTCEGCHVTGAAKESWQAIASTGGHKFHLQSDSVAKAADVAREAEYEALVAKHGEGGHLEKPAAGLGVECLSCHARSAHRFQPADSTCSQKGCHLTDEIKIRLGKMSQAQGLHCNACHQFTKVLPQLADVDSARGTLRPASRQCFSCHEMRQALSSFDVARDPHGGACGMCHNPHENVKPADALKTCTSAGCHADWRGNDFHMGAAHVKVAQKCETCHAPHAAKVDAADCTGCHNAVAEGARKDPTLKRPRVPETFDTSKALQRRAEGNEPRTLHGKGDAPPEDPPAAQSHVPAPARADDPPRPFEHDEHKQLKCITCHDVKSRENKVTFASPRGCLICHHEARQTTRDCAACHADEQVRQFQHAEQLRVKVKKADVPARTRTVQFRHATHENVKCADCHVAKVTLAPTAEAKNCTGCHDDHHAAKRDCASCHRTDESWKAHTRESHVACTECHAQATVARLLPDRTFCLGCHPPAVDHYADQECTQCHLLTSPEGFRPRLSSAQ
jgi:hypothetical protein